MIATYVQPRLTPVTPEDASRAIRAALTEIAGPVSNMAVAIMHAQQALETGHFKSCWNYGVGNIKAGEKYSGLYTCIKLNEVIGGRTIWFSPLGELDGKDGPVKGKTWPVPEGHPQTRMRAYNDLIAAERGKMGFLAEKRWRPSLDRALAGDAAGYVEVVRVAGYFTAPLLPYQRSVVSLTAKYLPVAEATEAQQPAPPVDDDDLQLCEDMAECFRFELPDWLRVRLALLRAQHIDDTMDQVRRDRDRDIAEGS